MTASRSIGEAYRRARANATLEVFRMTPETARIVRTVRDASDEAREAGETWYSDAAVAVATIAADRDVDYRTVAATVAALSPRCAWRTNVAWADRMVDAARWSEYVPALSTLDNRRKAWAVAHGEDPLAILQGPKVRSFYRNLCGDLDAVTVDVWAARVAEGRANPNAPKGARYDRIAEAYRSAAAILGMAPAHVQAIAWCAIRGAAE